MAPSIKITYFPIKAMAEPCRFILKYGGIEFEDDRFEGEQWPKMKPTTPFGQVPLLTGNGKTYHQSLAMARFCAKQAKLVGKDDWEDLEIDSVVDTINDLRLKIAQYSYEQDATIKESRKGPLFNETIPFYLDRLDKMAKENNGHLACKRLTWADMYLAALLDYLNFMLGKNLLEKHANLTAVVKNVLELPSIKKWVAERPQSQM